MAESLEPDFPPWQVIAGGASALAAPPGRAGYGTKIKPLGVIAPLMVTLLTAPVSRLIAPRELGGYCGAVDAGQTVGALLALHGVTEVYRVPGLNGPVMASTVSALESVVYSVPVAEVAQAMSSTGLEIFRTCRFWPPAPAKISSWSPWEFSTKSPANFGEPDGTTVFESGSVSARVTFAPAFGAFTAVAVVLSAKNGATEAVLAAAFSVTTNTAGAAAGALPPVPGADALIRIFPLYAATASVPPMCGSGEAV